MTTLAPETARSRQTALRPGRPRSARPARLDRRLGRRARAGQVAPETLRAHWRSAFDAAEAALSAASRTLPPSELREHAQHLAAERASTALLLQAFARDYAASARFESLPLPPRDAHRLLGLPPAVTACVFNLDGVLIGSAGVHAEAWTKTFDRFLWTRSERAHQMFVSFDPRADYQSHLHGKPRLEGIRDFLASRGISLPEGRSDDPPGAETVHGLANQKKALLERLLADRELVAFAGAREFLETARDAHVPCAVVSASESARTMLSGAGLSNLVDEVVDGKAMVAEGLRTRPEPDVMLAACRELGVEPRHAAAFETTSAGVAAARAAGFALVVGVGRGDRTRELREAGADLVVPGLEELLDRAQAA